MTELKPICDDGDLRFQTFVRVWAAFGLLLFGVTWKLWTPQSEFPQIPFFECLISVPAFVDWIALAIVASSLTIVLATRSYELSKTAALVFAVAALVLISLNQHRLQPWAYQFVIFAVLIATPARSAQFWMRWIVISIYVYSAISKFDYQFVHTVGEQMLSALSGFVGLDPGQWPESARNWLVVLFPTGELLVGIGLAFPGLRRMAVWVAVGLHVVLIFLLGPLGLNHQPGVLIWNLFFIVQVIGLFGNRAQTRFDRLESKPTRPAASFVAMALSVFVILFPATQPLGICDHWPAWEVYAPRSSRAEIIDLPEAKTVPEGSIAAWSISALGVPVYPQARFQLGVAMAWESKLGLDREMRVELKSQSTRRTGDRQTESLVGRDQLTMRASRFRLNTKYRTTWLQTD